MNFNLPQSVNFILDMLINNGHKAYIVGGCVRDLLCGKGPHDYDITTSATPDVIQSLFNKTVATGIKHGTITVIIGGEAIEVTTFRTEGIYNDNRHPESVIFVCDVADDLARRDFTINAMCYNHYDGLIDLYGGKDDIKRKLLKAVGNAETRFGEDALRILRLFRFAATLGFTIEKQTFDAAIKCAQSLKTISAERIFTELQKAASGDNIECLSPLLHTNCLADYYIGDSDLTKIKILPKNENLCVFALLNITSNNLSHTLERFKCSNAFKDYSLKMNYLISNQISNDKISIKKALNFSSAEIVLDVLIYYRDILGVDITHHLLLLDEIKAKNEPYKISQLDISGSDIVPLGYSGKQIGEILDFLLNKVIENPDLNSREKLLNLICN